jgi:hypothetical protein
MITGHGYDSCANCRAKSFFLLAEVDSACRRYRLASTPLGVILPDKTSHFHYFQPLYIAGDLSPLRVVGCM